MVQFIQEGASKMPTMNISLTDELEMLIQEKVSSGMYHSASEVVREGLRLLREQDEIRRVRLEELRKEISRGTEQLERGEHSVYPSGKELADKVKSEGRKRARTGGKSDT
jgi:antitoxin ParD1/3/4